MCACMFESGDGAVSKQPFLGAAVVGMMCYCDSNCVFCSVFIPLSCSDFGVLFKSIF